MRVRDVMKKKVKIIRPETTLKEAAKIMSKNKIGSLAIVRKKEIAGIITERDILKNIEALNKRVSSFMTKKVISIDSYQHIEIAADLMSQNKIKRVLVTEGDKLKGIITATDIIANSNLLNDSFLL